MKRKQVFLPLTSLRIISLSRRLSKAQLDSAVCSQPVHENIICQVIQTASWYQSIPDTYLPGLLFVHWLHLAFDPCVLITAVSDEWLPHGEAHLLCVKTYSKTRAKGANCVYLGRKKIYVTVWTIECSTPYSVCVSMTTVGPNQWNILSCTVCKMVTEQPCN